MPCATKAVPTAVVVELAVPVRTRLRRLAASVTAQVRQALRAEIILAAADGLANAAIARELKVSVNTVHKWRGRFAAVPWPLSRTRNGPAGSVSTGSGGHSHQHAPAPGVDLVPPEDRHSGGWHALRRDLAVPGRPDRGGLGP